MAEVSDRDEKIAALKIQIEALQTEQKRLVPLALHSEYPKDEDAAMALGYIQMRLTELHDELTTLEQESK